MFGTLFDEDTKGNSVAEAPAFSPGCPESNLPPPRPSHLLCGLHNQGTTCYLNSLIQTLFFTPEFREAIFKLTPEELGIEGASKSKVRIIIIELQNLFARMLLIDAAATSTAALTESFGWVEKEAFQQQDAQELMRILFEAIQTSLVGTSCSTLISKLYGGSTADKITCKSCGNVSEKTDFFLDVNVAVTDYSCLAESLSTAFVENETMEGTNQYYCNKCDCHVDAIKETKIRSLPPILVLSLLRLGYDVAKKQRFKEIGRFEFPMEINMNPFCEKEMSLEETDYELYAIVIHSGSSHCGHYNVYVQDVNHIGTWEMPGKKIVITNSKRSPSPEERKKEIPTNRPLDMVATLVERCGPTGIHFDTLSAEIIKAVGVGWNKKYKKRLGSLNRFVQKHDELFFVCEERRIVRHRKFDVASDIISTLTTNRVNGVINELSCENEETADDERETAPDCSISDPDQNSCRLNGADLDCKLWFDINDINATPISTEHIQMQFGGRSSAYMLFFRRKFLQKNLKGREETLSSIPPHLVQLVNGENEELTAKRQEFDKTVNQVLLFVHFGCNYFVDKGIVQPIPDTLSVTEIVMDRRLLVQELYTEILTCFGQLSGNLFCMHRCKEVPAGLHFYDDLLKVYASATIQDAGLESGSRIFVWNGETIQGSIEPVSVGIGEMEEPLLLHIVLEKDDGCVEEIDFAFPGVISLNVLLLSVGEQLDIPPQNLSISRICSGNRQNIQTISSRNEEKSLREMQLCNGDYLYVELRSKRSRVGSNHLSRPIPSETKTSVKIENRCEKLTDDNQLWPVIEVDISKTALVSELKATAVTVFDMSTGKSYLLRMQKDALGLNPPLHENQCVEDLGQLLQSALILEEGLPPSEQQMVVTCSGNYGSGDTFSEFTINCDLTVGECLQTILLNIGVSGGEWYLQRVNCFGEPAAVLTKADATLVSEGVKHGSHLVVKEGHIVPHGYLSFTIHLFPSLLQKTQTPGKHWSWVMEKLLKFQNDEVKFFSNYNRSLSTCVGEVEISAEATLANLKQQILTLPLLVDLELYSQPECVRLRLMSSGRCGQILRGHQQMLKKLKLLDQTPLCIQILSSTEDLSADTLVLEVVEKLGNTNKYSDPMEVLWETRNGSLNCFRHSIATQLFRIEENLRFAKYNPEEFSWTILTNDTQIRNNHKSCKKKKNKQIFDLRNAPYFLKDGDRIAIQDVNQEWNKDFSSEDDIINRQRLEVEKKEKLRVLEQEKNKCPEVGIRIAVGNFS